MLNPQDLPAKGRSEACAHAPYCRPACIDKTAMAGLAFRPDNAARQASYTSLRWCLFVLIAHPFANSFGNPASVINFRRDWQRLISETIL